MGSQSIRSRAAQSNGSARHYAEHRPTPPTLSPILSAGKLAFNVFYPNFKLMEQVGVENTDLEWIDPQDASITVRRSFLRKSFDKLNQFFEGELIFRSYRGQQLVNEERSTLNMSFYTYPQIILLLKSARFRVTEEYGSYDKEPISICKEMIFIAEKE